MCGNRRLALYRSCFCIVYQAAIKGEEWTPVEREEESSGPTIIPEPKKPPPRRPASPSNQLWGVLLGTISKQRVCDTSPELCSICCKPWSSFNWVLRQVQSAIKCYLFSVYMACTYSEHLDRVLYGVKRLFETPASVWTLPLPISCCGHSLCQRAWAHWARSLH